MVKPRKPLAIAPLLLNIDPELIYRHHPIPDGKQQSRDVDLERAVDYHELPVPYTPQQYSNWCWAACLAMLRHYYSQMEIEQCEIVTSVYAGLCPAEQHGCCDPLCAAHCNLPLPVALMTAVAGHWQLGLQGSALAVSFPQLKNAIRNNRSLIIFVENPHYHGVGHFAVICGYCEDESQCGLVKVLDPDLGAHWFPYAELLMGYYWNNSVWRFSFIVD